MAPPLFQAGVPDLVSLDHPSRRNKENSIVVSRPLHASALIFFNGIAMNVSDSIHALSMLESDTSLLYRNLAAGSKVEEADGNS